MVAILEMKLELTQKEKMKMKTKTNELTSENLQNALWETLKLARSKKLKPTEANAVAAQAREICRVSKLNLEYMKLTGKTQSKTKGILSLE